MENQEYYNTTNLKGKDLENERSNALTQSDIILDVFKGGRILTPFEVLELSGLNCPITSIRRSITNLTYEGLLVKTDILREGKYGKPNYCWRLNVKNDNQLELF